MRYKEISQFKQYILRINRGEEVIATLTQFCQDNNIFSGSLYGVGACDEAELGHYSVTTKQYSKQTFTGEHEVISLIGIITDKKIHIHASIANNKFQTFSGHLTKMTISGAGEIHLFGGQETVTRQLDETTGLELLNI